MMIWIGEELILPYSYVILFCVFFYIHELSMIWATMKDAAGLWHFDRFRMLFGAMFNLILNLHLVKYIGLYGIILSTIISYIFISMPWLVHNLFKYLFKENMWQYLRRVCLYFFITCCCSVLTYYACCFIKISGIKELIIKGTICILIPFLIQFLFFFKLNEFKKAYLLIKKIII